MRRGFLVIGLLIAALFLAACGSTTEPEVVKEVVKETVEVVVTQEVEKEVEVVVTQEVEVVVTQEVDKEVQVLALPGVDPLEVSGDIVTAGSSTVFPDWSNSS